MIRKILDLTEVWALLIPLFFLLYYKKKLPYLRPVRIFIWTALALNIFIILIQEYKQKWWGLDASDFLWNNNFLYNIESIVRMLLFAWFFILLNQRFMHRVKAIIPFAFICFVLINFIFFEKFFPRGDYEAFSSRLLATESALLLFYCLQYFIFLIIEEKTSNIQVQAGFWVVTGLTIYVAASFFIYLFYDYLTDAKRNFAINIWDVHNIVFIILNVFIAVQLFQENKISRK
jgi:hypothetical protein